MIGKPVSGEKLAKVLGRQAERDKYIEQLQQELKALKPGDCLLYEDKLGMASAYILPFLVGVEGLKMIREGDQVYVYKEKEIKY